MIEYPSNGPVAAPETSNTWESWTSSALLHVALAAGSGFLMVLSLWGTWFRVLGSSGNSFRMLNTADLLGLDEVTPFRVFWFLIPVLYLLCLVANAAKRHRLAGGIQLAISLPVGIVAAALLYVGPGAWGAAAATLAAVSSSMCSVILIVGASRRRRDDRSTIAAR